MTLASIPSMKGNLGFGNLLVKCLMIFIYRVKRSTYLHMLLSQVFSLCPPSLNLGHESTSTNILIRKPKGDLFDEVRVYRTFK